MPNYPGQTARHDPNYVPGVIVTDFQDATKSVAVKGDSATGRMLVNSVSASTTDGSAKTQIVDGSGNVVGSTSNALDVNIKSGGGSTPTAVVAFRTTVTTATTRVQLASNAISGVILEAPSTNTGLIYVGGSNVSSTVFGAELQAGQSTSIAIDNTSKIWVDASVNGDKVAALGS